jgi:hypothetical protein
VRAGASLNGGHEILAEQVEMIYWFAQYPTSTIRFPYSQAQYEEDERYLSNLISQIASHSNPKEFFQSADEKSCAYCQYRTLCGRGMVGGELDDFDDDQNSEENLGSRIDMDNLLEVPL